MHKRIAAQRLVFRVALAVVMIFVLYFYVFDIYMADMKSFIVNTSGPVFVGLATLSGLAFSFASVIKTESDRSTVSLAAEKLLHSTLHFIFAVLLGVISIQLSETKFLITVSTIIRILLSGLGIYIFVVASQSALYGVEWLSDILYTRWSRRAIITDDPKKTIEDSLEYPIEGLPEKELENLPSAPINPEKSISETVNQKLANNI